VAVHLATIALSGTIALLPRYYIAILPPILVTATPKLTSPGTHLGGKTTMAAGLLAALALFSVVNHHGDFYPAPDHDFYVVAERSTRAQELLELQVEGTELLAATGLPIMVDNPAVFRLIYPEMGYVERQPEEVISVVNGIPDELPDSFAMLIERRYANRLVTIEEKAISQGYDLHYEHLSRLGFEFQLVIATKPPQ
jgi:hypothetical protein